MNYNISFTYSDSHQLKDVYKKLLKDQGLTMSEASKRLGLSTPQQLTNKFNKKGISLDELKELLSVAGCEYEIVIRPMANGTEK